MKIFMLIVEDDSGLRSSLQQSFRRKGYEVLSTSTGSEALEVLRAQKIDLILLDVRLPDGSGLDILTAARDLDEEIQVVMMTAFPEIKTAVRAMKGGAHDFVVKPFELEELHLVIERAVEAIELRRKVDRLERERDRRNSVAEIIGESVAIQSVHSQIRKVAAAEVPVLVVGETGTGKELVADSIHRLSPRAEGPLIKVNCSTFSEHLLESELFGHEKGAFTDARRARPGLFEIGNGGTIFLDEISEMKPELQAKLLRVVEGHPFRRVGGQREIEVNTRILAATNRDIGALIQSGHFREDLYFRLNVIRIEVPPLRSRGNDVVLLARFFLERAGAKYRGKAPGLAPATEELLLAYDWPGNVRELQGVMERAALLCETGEIGVEDLPAELHAGAFVRRQANPAMGSIPTLRQVECRFIAQVVDIVDGNLSEAARILGIARNTLKSRLRSSEADPVSGD